MKTIASFTLIFGTLTLLVGCAGTATDFECNATTSDSCLTIEQANEKAKKLEMQNSVKSDAVALPHLAKGDFRTVSLQTQVTELPLAPATGLPHQDMKPAEIMQTLEGVFKHSENKPHLRLPSASTGESRPQRIGDKTAGLWIAPYIDTQDVYHQSTRVFFVVKPSSWGTPRVNIF